MRLLDQIVHAKGTATSGARADYALALERCPVRYVLDERATARTKSLLATDRDMLVSENSLLRVPEPEFWIEWRTHDESGTPGRLGALVLADEAGRAGTMQAFRERAASLPEPAFLHVHFDLDAGVLQLGIAGEVLTLSAGMHSLAPNLGFTTSASATENVRSMNITDITRDFNDGLPALIDIIEMVFAFSVLLMERSIFEPRTVDLSKLNQQRVRKGSLKLLDHIEVRFSLDEKSTAAALAGHRESGTREAARLHHVRGHMVERHGKRFWRRSHLRGDASKAPATKTFRVTSSANVTPPVKMADREDG